MNLEEFRSFAEQLAIRSGELIRDFYQRPELRVETKADETPVTAADRDAEEMMRAMIAGHYPDHGVIGEEFGRSDPDAEFVWVLDPIDGTISFTTGVPLFGTLIGLLHQGQPVLGAIHQPIVGQLCIGSDAGTTLNGRPVRVREPRGLNDAVLLTTDIAHVAKHQDLACFERLRAETKLFRTWGDCYGYLLVATGKADIMLDPIMNPWDLLPLVPIIRGAGGTISSWSGEDPVTATSAVAAHADLHPEIIRRLAGS